MSLTIHDTIRSELHAVDQTVDALEDLGLASAKQAKAARDAAERAHQAEKLSIGYTRHIEAEAIKAGERLSAKDDLQFTDVVDALHFPTTDSVDVLLSATWNANVRAARQSAFANIGKAPAVLTARFDVLSAEVLEIAAQLGDVTTPQEAINCDLVEPWKRLMVLKAEYNYLSSTRDTLRSFNLIPSPPEYRNGWWWQVRSEYPLGTFKKAHEAAARDEGRQLLILTCRCRPWCPSSQTEAESVLKADEHAGVSA